MDKLASIRAFTRVVQHRSFVAGPSTLCVLPLTLIKKAMASSEALTQDQDRIAPLRSVFAPLTGWLQ